MIFAYRAFFGEKLPATRIFFFLKFYPFFKETNFIKSKKLLKFKLILSLNIL